MPIFLEPWFLTAALSVGIPIAIHLLHRRRPKPVIFSTTRFLKQALSKTRRSRHVTHFLALLMRILILLLLAFAFSRPKLRISSWLPESRRNVIIVLDSSASMRCRNGEMSTFEQGRDWALSLLNSLESGDKAALLLPGSAEPEAFYPPVSNHRSLNNALQNAEPGWGAGDLPSFLRTILKKLPKDAKAEGTEIHVFSDFQKSSWDTAAAADIAGELAERRVVVFMNSLGAGKTVNAGFKSVRFQPPAILGSGEFTVSAELASAAGFAGTGSVRLEMAGQELKRHPFELAADDTQQIKLAATAETEGPVTGQISLSDDAFEPDNHFYFSLPRVSGIPVLIADGGSMAGEPTGDSFFLNLALQPGGRGQSLYSASICTWNELQNRDLSQYQVLFVCNPPQINQADALLLEQFAQDGGTVVIYPGELAGVETGLHNLRPFSDTQVRKTEASRQRNVKLLASATQTAIEKRIMRIFPQVPSLVMHRRLIFENLPEKTQPLFLYPNETPFMLRLQTGSGAVWVSSVAAGRDWSNWPLSPLFLVTHHELVNSAARRNLPSLMCEIGGTVTLPASMPDLQTEFRITGPGGTEKQVALERRTAQTPFLLGNFNRPGIYHIDNGDKTYTAAVNVPAAESGFVGLTGPELENSLEGASTYFAASWHEQEANLVNLNQGRPLWPLLLLLAFLLALSEELFTNFKSWSAAIPENMQKFLKRGGIST